MRCRFSWNPFLKPLSAQEEKSCLDAYQRGDTKARDILVERNLRLVAHVVKKYQGLPDDLDDLISIGTIGLIKAVMTYDSKKGNRLAAYAARCIDNELLMYLRSKKKMAREISLYEPMEPTRKEMRSICSTSRRAEGEDINSTTGRGRGAAVLLSGLGIKRAGKTGTSFPVRPWRKSRIHTETGRCKARYQPVVCVADSRKMRSKNCVYGLPLRKCLTFQTDCFYNKG